MHSNKAIAIGDIKLSRILFLTRRNRWNFKLLVRQTVGRHGGEELYPESLILGSPCRVWFLEMQPKEAVTS